MDSGVYYIKNNLTNQFYIGSSININKRISTHVRTLLAASHYNPKLQRSYNKYGKDCFEFGVLLYETCNDLLIIEQMYIDFLKPYFNISKNTSSPMLGRKHTTKTKDQMSKKRLGIKQPGKRQSEQARLKRSNARRGWKWSSDVKKKMSDTAKRLNSISRVDRFKQMRPVRSDGIIFKSLSDCAKHYRVAVSCICDILKGRTKKSRKGIEVEYV